MKKVLLFFVLLMISLSVAFSAEVSFDFLAFRSNETNIFSDPLPLNGSNSFLQGKVDNPYLDRVDYGGKLNMNLFFVSGSRTGLSFSFTYGHAVSAEETIPVSKEEGKDFSSGSAIDWEYHSYDALSDQQDKLSFALGPVFRFEYSFIELGGAVRAAISTFDFFDSFTVGLEVQPYFRAYFNKWVYASVGFSFTSHLFHFIESEMEFYETNYSFMSLTPFVGLGVRFGGAE